MGRFWVGSSGNWSDDTNHWATSSNGSPGAGNLPTSSDDVFIDSNSGLSGGTITLDVVANCLSFSSTTGISYSITAGAASIINFYGNLTFESGLTISTIDVYLQATSSGKTVTTAGRTTASTNAVGLNGGWTLQDNLTTTGEFYQENGTFDANGHNVTANDFYFYANIGFTPTIIKRTGTFTPTQPSWVLDENNGVTVTILDNPVSNTGAFFQLF